MNFSDADKRLYADHPSAHVFPRTTVGKLRGLLITDALQVNLKFRACVDDS